uniref:Uncharacterized protein n=1 Tax=Romanomermis culicivorax TaxID=13658 RepID=A0A915KN26_ROMCU
MVDFGPIKYFPSQELKNTLLIVESRNPQLYYLFQKKSSKRLPNNVLSNYYKTLIPIIDHHDLPIEYCLTLRRREAHSVDNDADLVNERLLLYQEQDFLVFSSDLDLETLHQSECWIMDGAFEMCPKPFMQLHTIHGFKNGEEYMAPWAL